jgi:hypothetical protein
MVIPDAAMDGLAAQFHPWNSSILGKSTRELKGGELTGMGEKAECSEFSLDRHCAYQ